MAAAVAPAPPGADATPGGAGGATSATTATQLARAFGLVVRQLSDLLGVLADYGALAPNLPRLLHVTCAESLQLQVGGVGGEGGGGGGWKRGLGREEG